MSIISSAKQSCQLLVFDKPGFKEWIKSAPSGWALWAADHGFDCSPAQKLIFPASKGNIAAGVIGSNGDAFIDGAVAATLPPCVWDIGGDTGGDTGGGVDASFGLGFMLEQYRFERYKQGQSGGNKKTRPKPQLVVGQGALRHRIEAISAGICHARDLINLPANHLNPDEMERQARALAKKSGANIKVVKGPALVRDFPAIAVVGAAAAVPPRLIDMHWDGTGGDGTGGDRRGSTPAPRITLVGKGVTFDSGGLNIKPSSAMEIMKKDMGGAAIVLGLAQVIMALNLPIHLRVLIPVAENAISSQAYRPLDVIASAAGIPVEVGNTDAEGRLLLADALHCATHKAPVPDLVIDFATLTGAARVALGTELPAVFSNDANLGAEFVAAGQQVADPLWAMPLHAPYDRDLECGSGALSSTGKSPLGGAITAALFLQRFLAKPVPWAHIDVMAWNTASRLGHPRGGEAMGLRAALNLIENRLIK